MKYIYALLFGICGGAVVAHAQIIITEVMYDAPGSDKGAEWIEIYNAGGNSVDITEIKLLENNIRHGITGYSTSVLSTYQYGVIVDDINTFLSSNVDVTIPLFDSSFSLSNSGETISLVNNEDTVLDSFTYTSDMGAGGDGNSLQITAEGIVAGEQNLGSSMSDHVPSSNATTTIVTTDTKIEATVSAHAGATPINTVSRKESFALVDMRDRVTVSGAPLIMRAEGNTSELSYVAWSFGDGTQEKGELVRHAYHYPGTYTVVANARRNSEDAVARFEVMVFEPDFSLVEVTDAYVEISNNAHYEVNVGGWFLETESEVFTFPQDTIIASGNSVKFRREILGGSFVASSSPVLRSPIGVVVAKW